MQTTRVEFLGLFMNFSCQLIIFGYRLSKWVELWLTSKIGFEPLKFGVQRGIMRESASRTLTGLNHTTFHNEKLKQEKLELH